MKFWHFLLIKFVWIILILTVITSSVISVIYFTELKTAETLLNSHESINIASSKEAITRNLESVAADLLILSQHEAFAQPGIEGQLSTDNLAKDLLVMITAKQQYDQIRFLNETGMEVVRVNFNRGQPYIVDQADLQDKSNRYYFQETFELSKHDIFISPFDLNVEKGKIELPYKPMIRLATPVFDQQGRKRGIVIINYLGEDLITGLLVAASNIIDHVTLLNSDSYWLHNPNSNLEWGFMLENDQKFKSFFPGSWSRISEVDSGQFQDSNGLFTYDTIYPFPRNLRTTAGTRTSGTKASNYYWKLVSHVSPKTIHATRADIRTKLLGVGGPLYFLLIVGGYWLSYALTKRKQVEYELEQHHSHLEELVYKRTEDLNSANEELSDFSRIVSHDLRAPLRAIRQYIDFLHEDLEMELSDDQQDYLDGMMESVIKADTLVSDLLHLARIGRKIPITERVDTGMLLLEIWDGFAFPPEFTVKMPDDWPIIDSAPLIFRILFHNLISNAVKFNKSIHREVALGWSEPDADHWEFYVRDMGIGIEPRFHDQIFKVFERLHTDEEYEGTGIGLAIVRKTVNILQGTIRIESELGKETTFFVTIPKTKTEEFNDG